MGEDYVAAEIILKAYPDYLKALSKRGLPNVSLVRCLLLSACEAWAHKRWRGG
jgi:hypothetical protein